MDSLNDVSVLINFTHESHTVNYLFMNPVQIVEAYNHKEVCSALRSVERAVQAGLYAAGYVSYEAASAFHPHVRKPSHQQLPLVWFGLFKEPIEPPNLAGHSKNGQLNWTPTVKADDYFKTFSNIKQQLVSGSLEQVNYTFRLTTPFHGDALSFYHRMKEAQGDGYHAYINLGRFRIVSASPELFFYWDGRRIVMRPMKGTVARGRYGEEDVARREWLFQSTKNRTENKMTVNLVCKELERIAENNTVRVTKWFDVERYSTVWQLTSTVEAMTRPRTGLVDIFSALYPSSSITGVPKETAMDLISDIECSPREVYCGAIGFMTPERETMFNVAIRTAWIDCETGMATYGVGGGITNQSLPEEEYREALMKGKVLDEVVQNDFCLLETIRLAHGKYTLLSRHLNRLNRSAQYFGIPVSMIRVQDELTSYASRYRNDVRRVRLLVSRTGDIQLESTPLTDKLDERQPVALATEPISKDDHFLYHKTTQRSMYDVRKRPFPDVFDVLLWNEDEELTEFTIGNLVVEHEGELWTPPVRSGLLPGTMREQLLERGLIRERVLTIEQLNTFTQIWLINSVRGWVPVYMVSSSL